MLSDALTATLLSFSRPKTIRHVEASSTTTFALLMTKPRLNSLDLRWTGPPPVVDSTELSLCVACAALPPLLWSLHAPALRRCTFELEPDTVIHRATSLDLIPVDAESPHCMGALVAAAVALEDLTLTIPRT